MSPSRYLSENALVVCADLLLRHHKMGPKQGFELMDETLLLGELFRCNKPNLSRFAMQIPRWEAIFDSKVLFIPVFKASHWSLLALAGCSDVLQVVWRKSYAGNASPKQPAQLVAVHFDSLSSLGHKDHIPNIQSFVEKGITALWRHRQVSCGEDGLVQPDIGAIIRSSLKIMYCDVEQQEDSVSCGWRTIRHMVYISTNGVKSPLALIQLANTRLALDFKSTRTLALGMAEKLARPSTSNIPSLTYPLHGLVDAAKLSHFNATSADLREKAVMAFRFGKDEADENAGSHEAAKTRKNATKNAQSDAILQISKNVVSDMKRKGLDKRKVGRKEIDISERMSLEIAKYLFHYPPGTRYAECLYYTRYAYPDSFLVCLGVDVLFSPNPRLFCEFISPSSSRIKRSRSVHFQVDIFKSISRTATKYYDDIARFRLQEMVEHFRGVAEAVLKSCAKQAMHSDEGGLEMSPEECGTESGTGENTKRQKLRLSSEGAEQAKDESCEDEGGSDEVTFDLTSDIKDPEDSSWNFASSIVFQRPVHNELGTIRSTVSAREIAEDLDTCLKAADYVANEAIFSRIGAFEKYCRRSMQVQNRSVRVNSVKERVTGQSLASIPSTFSNNFLSLLKSEIRNLWSQELESDTFRVALDEMLSRLTLAANSLFRRNGQVFFGISGAAEHFSDDPETLIGKMKKPKLENSRRRKSLASTLEKPASDLPGKSDTEFVSFGLGFCTEMELGSDEKASSDIELLSLMLFVFQECHSQNVKATTWLSDDESGNCLQRTYAQHFSDIRCRRDQALDVLQISEAQPWWEDGTKTMRYRIKQLKLKLLRRVCQILTSPDALLISNSLFCFEVPIVDDAKPNTEQDIASGKSLTIFHGVGQGMEDVSWNLKVNEISVRSMPDDEAGIFRSNFYALLADVRVTKTKLPNIKVFTLKAEVLSTADVWSEADFEVKGNQYLGVRRFDPVKLILSIHSDSEDTTVSPLNGDYVHCFIGFVFNNPTPIGDSGPQKGSSPSDVERLRCIGPMRCHFEVVLHDDLYSTSRVAVSAMSFVERWSNTNVSNRSCYVVSVDSVSIREEASHYFALANCSKTPRIFRLAMVNLNMAESYELERRKRHYLLMRHMIAEDPFQKHRFRPLQNLEDEHLEMMRSVVGFFDQSLSDAQHHLIHKVLYGWRSDNSPNGSRVLEHTTNEMKECLTKSGTVSRDDLAFWGSNLCILDGCPGSGKSRTIAALICTVMHSMALPSSMYEYKGKPRALVVTVSNSAMEDLFCKVCNILRASFGRNHAKYRQSLKKMVCVSSRSTKDIVRSRQISYLQEMGVPPSVFGEATVVFTTVSNLHRREMCNDTPFSILIVDEAEFLQDEGLLESVAIAFVRYNGGEPFQRATILISGNQLGHEDSKSETSSTERNFFNRTQELSNACELTLRASLSKQYRMSPLLQKFFEPFIFDGSGNSDSQDGTDLTAQNVWAADNFLEALRNSKDHPLRSMMVIDTSLDKKNAYASSGGSGSLFNEWEAITIRYLLLRWAGDELTERDAVQKRVTVLCAYSKQRAEIARELTNEGLSRVQVRTLDQVMGVENDIIILSLVETHTQEDKNNGRETEVFPPTGNSYQWMKLACTRARKALVVVGFGKHHCEQDSHWGHLFRKCLAEAEAVPGGSCGYYRPRFIAGRRDFKLTTFSPLYASTLRRSYDIIVEKLLMSLCVMEFV